MQFCGFSNVDVISVNIINDFVCSIHIIKLIFLLLLLGSLSPSSSISSIFFSSSSFLRFLLHLLASSFFLLRVRIRHCLYFFNVFFALSWLKHSYLN